jgi:hypothetical protein
VACERGGKKSGERVGGEEGKGAGGDERTESNHIYWGRNKPDFHKAKQSKCKPNTVFQDRIEFSDVFNIGLAADVIILDARR